MKEALLYDKLNNKDVQCRVCNHHCTIKPDQRGICGVRENIDGQLNFLVYEKAISESIDPIEKKPFFNFYPGSKSLSIATVGCNMRCDNCQNWQISQATKNQHYKDLEITGDNLKVKKVIDDAVSENCKTIAYTYTEPTIWMEYALDCMKLAHKKNIKNIWVSNGYMSNETLDLILPYLDAINIDLKFFDTKTYQKNCGAKLEPILKNLKRIKKSNTWIEITTLAIPTLSDNQQMFNKISKFIYQFLGAETPWHISAFSSQISHKLHNLPDTTLHTLELSHKIGVNNGLKYVYTGNMPGLDTENTYCSKCGKIAIRRFGYVIERIDNKRKCANCKTKLDIIE